MTVAKLCCTMSGWSFQEYLAKMRQDREWVDTALLHALGRAHGVHVVVLDVPCRAFGCVHAFAAVHSAVVASSHRSHKQNCRVRSVRIKTGIGHGRIAFRDFCLRTRARSLAAGTTLVFYVCSRNCARGVCTLCVQSCCTCARY